MELKKENLLVRRPYKEVYRCGDSIVKVFATSHPKSAVFNEALITARVEETGLPVSKLKEVTQIDGKWSLVIEYKAGRTMADLMSEAAGKDDGSLVTLMEQFVDLQRLVQSRTSPMLPKLKDKLAGQINGLKVLDATQRYDLLTRLESMPTHEKVCHGDFNPSNVIVDENGSLSIIDWAHAAQGNASADAAMTYLLFALKDRKMADLYMTIFCKKSDTAKQYVQQWLPIVAASQLEKEHAMEKDFLLRWINVGSSGVF